MASILRVDQANVDVISTKTAGGTVYIPGHVIQVVQSFKSDTWTGTPDTFTDITGLSAVITPKSTSSKILCMAYVGKIATPGSSWYTHGIRFARNGTGIGVADAAGSRPRAGLTATDYDNQYNGNFSLQYLDSPASTASLTYSLQVLNHSTSTVVYINRGEVDTDSTDNAYYARSASSITLMEIAQ